MTRRFCQIHLGLGDALLCNGLVRTLVKRGDALLLPAYPHNLQDVRSMFADLGDAVEVEDIGKSYQSVQHNPLRLGYYARSAGTDTFDESQFDREFYRQAGVPFENKWNEFSMPMRDYVPDPTYSRTLIHDDPDRGFVIPLAGRHISAKTVGSLADLAPLLQNADAFHGINSAPAILADLLGITCPRYLHRYARPDGGALPVFREGWEVIESL